MTMPKWGSVYTDPISKQKSTTKPWWLGISQGLYDFGQSLPKVNFGQWGQQISQDWSKMFPSDKPFATKVTKPKPKPLFTGYTPWPEEAQMQVSPEVSPRAQSEAQAQQSVLMEIYSLAPIGGFTKYELDKMAQTITQNDVSFLNPPSIEELPMNYLMIILNDLQRYRPKAPDLGLETATAKARLQPQLAAQRRSGMDATGGDLTRTIQKAKAMGIDTTDAESALGQYEGNEESQTKAQYRLNMAMQDVKTNQTMIESTWLAQDYPDWYKQYDKTLGKETAGGTSGGQSMGGNWALQGFSSWAERNPEFQEAIAANEKQMFKDYGQAYIWYKEYQASTSYEDWAGGTETKSFDKWLKTQPLAQAYLEQEETGKTQPQARRATSWTVARQR